MKWLLLYTVITGSSHEAGIDTEYIRFSTQSECVAAAKALHSQAKAIAKRVKFESTCMEVN